MRITLLILFLTLMVPGRSAQAQLEIPVWGENQPLYSKPHAIEEYEADCWKAVCAYQIVKPTLTLYLPEGQSNGNAVIIMPGGGYEAEAVYYEGFEIAEALASRGTVAAVLKYRLPNPETATHPEQVPLSDLHQALLLLREGQATYNFSATRFGVLGFSAGSHLATVASVNRVANPLHNPDFSMLIYGVTKFTPDNQEWLEKTLYHRKMTADEITEQTLLKRINQNTPPAFLVHALDDDVCHFTESTLYAEALTEHGVDAEIHLFAHGGHGFGGGREEDGTDQWLELAASWLNRLSTDVAK